MTENNKLFNALDQLQFNTDNNELKVLEERILTKENLENIKADEGSDLYDFLNGTDIKNIINNGHQIRDGIIISFYTRFLPTAKFHVLHVSGHYKTVDKINNEIFDSLKDGRQPIDTITEEVKEQGCGIHAIEGVLIAEALKSNEEIAKFKAKHNNQLVKTSEDDLIEQRKILFKMEILDALNNLPETVLGAVYNKKEDGTYEINGLSKLYELYFEEFKARCTALQAVKQELELEPDKVPEAQKVETPKQSDPAVIQQIKQEKEVETQKDDKKEETPKVEKTQKMVRRIIVENPEEIKKSKIEQKKEDKLKYGTPVVKNEEGENDKKFDLPSNETVNTLSEVIEERPECDTPSKEEPHSSADTQNSKISTTSSILLEHPKMKQDTVYDWIKKEDTKIETYDIENNEIKKIEDINKKAAQLYLDILMQVLNETNKESGLEEITEEKITAIIKQTEERVDACFTIRDENNNIIIKDLTDQDKEYLELARTDYKNRARVDERVAGVFNKLDELKNYQGATKEIQEKLLHQQALASKA